MNDRTVVLAVIAVATLVRAAYALLVADPMSGPDAPTYAAAAEALASNGS